MGCEAEKVIGLVHTRFGPTGGVETYLNKLVPSLLERNWRVHYVTARIQQPIPDGMILHKIPILRGTSVSRMLSFAYGARRMVRRARIPLVMGFGRTIHQDIYRDGSGCFRDYQAHAGRRFNPLYVKSYLHLERQRFCDPLLSQVITVSHMVKDQIIRRYGWPADQIDVVYSGVDDRNLNPGLKSHKTVFRRQLKIPPDAFTLLFMGNDFERKGLGPLIRALGHVPEQLNCVLLVAGTDKHLKRYRRLAVQSGLRERVRFLGYCEETSVLYGAADLFVLPSRFDPIANVVLEALYTGTPVVTGPRVGASELIENGVNGFVAADDQPAALAQAIAACASSPQREHMSRCAHQAAAPYCWRRHMDRLEGIFQRCLERKTGRRTMHARCRDSGDAAF